MGLLVFGAFWFWTLMAIGTCTIFYSIYPAEYDDMDNGGGLAFLTVLGTLLLLQWFGDVKVFSAISTNPSLALLALLAYLVVGAVWSIAKWYFYLHRRREVYNDKRFRILRDYRVDKVSDLQQRDKESVVRQLRDYAAQPKARENKQRIIVWMAYWPWSLVWTFFSDFVRRLCHHIYEWLHRLYQAISDHVWKGVEDDLQ